MTDVATRSNCNFVAQAIQDDGFSTSCMHWYAVLLSQKRILSLATKLQGPLLLEWGWNGLRSGLGVLSRGWHLLKTTQLIR